MKSRQRAKDTLKILRPPWIPPWTERASRLLALMLWGLGPLLWLGSLAYAHPAYAYLYPDVSSQELTLTALLVFVAYQGLATIGLVVILRGADRRFGWLMLAASFVTQLTDFASFYSVYALLVAPEADLPLAHLAAWVQNLWVVNLSLLFIYMPLLFPDGTLPSPRWKPVFWFITLYLSLFVLVLAIVDLPLSNLFLEAETPVRNPFGVINVDFIPSPVGRAIHTGARLLFGASLLVAIASLLFRWRGAGAEVRQQLKWLLYALGLLVALRAVDWFATLPLLESAGIAHTFELIIRNAQFLALIGVVAALGFAVLKYRLYDIDLVIRRTLQYTGLTSILALLYFGGIVLLQRIFRSLTGQADSPLITVITTLAIAALFNPLRRRIQDVVDRRLFREKYDAAQTLAAFARTARDKVELDELTKELLHVVQETMQPERMSIWLNEDV